MNRAILVLNAGSSSLKFSVYEVIEKNLTLAASGQIEGLGTSPHFSAKNASGDKLADEPLPSGKSANHDDAFAHLAAWLKHHFAGKLTPAAVGHRVVHGGQEHTTPVRITPDILRHLESLIPLVPLHQPANLAAIRAVSKLLPSVPQIACFDTAFHQGRAAVTQRFGLPDDMFKRGLRRWGFHGLSYESIAAKLPAIAPDIAHGRVIVAHLGSGASMCAMNNRKSIDTSMGFSALDGLCMGTRCGSIDPGAVLFLVREMGPDKLESLLYKNSGLKGISGLSNDMRDLLASHEPLAQEAVEYFVFRAIREIGALTAILGGLDALVFTAGIGEHSPEIRRRICDRLTWLGGGFRLDAAQNQTNAQRISTPTTSPSVWVIPTDEEGVIARHTLALIAPP